MDKLANGGFGLLSRLLPTITQLCLVAAATVTTFGYPLLFGLEAYGTFVATCALTFVVHRAVDLVLESMIADRSVAYMASFALIFILLSALAFMLADVIFNIDQFMIRPLLLASLILSTTVLNIMFKVGSISQQAMFGVSFLGALLLITIGNWYWHLSNIESIMVCANFFSSIVGLFILFSNRASSATICHRPKVSIDSPFGTKLVDALYRIGFSSFNLLLGFGVLVVAGRHLGEAEAGTLRLFSSLAVVGLWIVPISPKLFYSLASGVDTARSLVERIGPYLGSMFIALLCWSLAVTLMVGTGFSEKFGILPLAAAAYPVVVLSSILDKVILHQHGIRKTGIFVFAMTLAAVAALISVDSLDSISLLLFASLIGYPLLLTVFLARSFVPAALVAQLMASCAAAALRLGDGRFLALMFFVMLVSAFVVWRAHMKLA